MKLTSSPAGYRRRFAALLFLFFANSAMASLIAYYPLNEASGNVANDLATADGAQNATSASAASDWQVSGGILGGAVQFSPTAQTDVDEAFIYNTASSTTSILAGLPFTISTWVKTTSVLGANQAAVFLGDGTAFSSYYALGAAPNHVPQLVARNTTAINTTGPTAINDGQWHNLVGVISATNARALYLDGKLLSTSTTDVPNPTLNRLGLGALTRSSQTDAYGGLLDEVGLFDTAQSAPQIALLNAFPRFDNVPLNDPDFDAALSVFNAHSGSVNTGAWQWSYATGLSGALGTTGTTGGNPFVVLDNAGNGLAATAVPEPSAWILSAFGLGAGLLRRPRRCGAV